MRHATSISSCVTAWGGRDSLSGKRGGEKEAMGEKKGRKEKGPGSSSVILRLVI